MNSQDKSIVQIPLIREAHQVATKFASEQTSSKKSKQVYLNTLAVYAVHRYLKWLDIETDLRQSDCWNPILRHHWNVADLVIPNIGKIECRSVLPGETTISVPPEITGDLIGYLAIQFSEDLDQVQILGFAKTAVAGVIEISRLHSIDEFIDEILLPKRDILVNLSAWFEGIFDEVWLPIEALLNPSELAWKSSRGLSREDKIKRAKKLDLGLLVNGQQVALVVSIWTEENKEKGVLVQVQAMGEPKILPPGLKLTVTLESDEAEVIAREADNLIQLEFSENPGKQFTVQVFLENESVQEQFVV
ncbi:MAG: DUF1822 family protein [Sphaerospermopsis sp. SIO1G2]|nr:DUF1822 family protein [Sphaerospermopsis sp. SIO1G2]